MSPERSPYRRLIPTRMKDEIPATRSGRYRRQRPDKASEYSRRSNVKRPDRDRHDHDACTQCGARKTAHRKTTTTLCRTCWRQSIRP